MRLITSNDALSSNLTRLIGHYPSITFAVAWASASTPIFHQLLTRRAKIRKAIIGTHFYQTHPDVLDAFVGSQSVHFIFQPKGTFHPKVYLFQDGRTWEALIGSANLTSAAFTENSESMILVSSSDEAAFSIEQHIMSLIETHWPQSKAATKESALAYRTVWLQKQPMLRRLAGVYGKTKTRKLPINSSVMSMSWSEFLAAVKKDRFHDVDERLGLLRRVREAFRRQPVFSFMDLGLRQTIAGVPTNYDEQWGWFGSMTGAGTFWGAVNDNNIHLSGALDKIPLGGLISKSQYVAYIAEFIKAFPKGRLGIATASRLLALKRPDQFVCLDSKNQKELCEDFGISKTGMDYERYWEEVVERIIDSPWWNAPRPLDDGDADVWDGRAAMLDAIFYRP